LLAEKSAKGKSGNIVSQVPTTARVVIPFYIYDFSLTVSELEYLNFYFHYSQFRNSSIYTQTEEEKQRGRDRGERHKEYKRSRQRGKDSRERHRKKERGTNTGKETGKKRLERIERGPKIEVEETKKAKQNGRSRRRKVRGKDREEDAGEGRGMNRRERRRD
jgi:hypothetical protein